MSEAQQTIQGDTIEPTVEIETSGRVIRPWKQILQQIVNEIRIHVDSEGLHVSAVDPTNVCAIDTTLHAEAFEAYEATDTTLGIGLDYLGTALQHARYGKRTDDEINLTFDKSDLQTTVERDVDGLNLSYNERVALTDPRSLRDDFDKLDLSDSMDAQIELPTKTFVEIIRKLTDGRGKSHVAFSGGETTTIGQEKETRHSQIEIDIETGQATARYPTHFMGDIATAMNNALVETVSIEWGDEFPMFVTFDREDVYSGSIMVAPRIQS